MAKKKHLAANHGHTWRDKVESSKDKDIRKILTALEDLQPSDPRFDRALKELVNDCKKLLEKKKAKSKPASTHTSKKLDIEKRDHTETPSSSSFGNNRGDAPERSELDGIIADLQHEATRDPDVPRSYNSFVDSDGPSPTERLREYIAEQGRDPDMPRGPQWGDGFV